MPIGYVVFDLDGVLWDSDRLHFDAVNAALAPYGTQISEAEHITTFKGLPTRRKLTMLTEMGRIPASAHPAIAAAKRKATTLASRQIVPRPEVTALLRTLRANGWRQCCCSNSIRETVQNVLLGLELISFMDFTLSNEDVRQPKPSPEMYLKAASLWHVPPQSLIAVEDGEAGKQAARTAGCRVIAVSGPQQVSLGLMDRLGAPWHAADRNGYSSREEVPCGCRDLLLAL